MTTLVRFSSLGDVVLAAGVCAALDDDVCFVTLPRYHDLVRRFPRVVRVLGPGEAPPPGRVVDLHHNLRSSRIRADSRVERQDFRRRARVWFKSAPAEPVLVRYGRAAGVAVPLPPWLTPVERGDVLVIATGAAHATKRWPHWAALAHAWPGPVRAIGGPGDEDIVREIGGVVEDGFDRTIDAMRGGAVLVAGDTGLLHLGAAVGLPVAGVFGPTTSSDGFFSYGGTAVELDLPCRPCSRFGGSTCPVGDHACLRDLSVSTVLEACVRSSHQVQRQ